MSAKGVKLIPYDLTPLQAALIEWGRQNAYGRITIVFQDGVPVQGIIPTEDGAGTQTVLFDKIARKAGLLPT
ncbi:MAG: hypothetical protein PHI12_14725 [Dehalococcoidales bacterium]|nr:hypothetical protein [Dehalococcoidales bacterium]